MSAPPIAQPVAIKHTNGIISPPRSPTAVLNTTTTTASNSSTPVSSAADPFASFDVEIGGEKAKQTAAAKFEEALSPSPTDYSTAATTSSSHRSRSHSSHARRSGASGEAAAAAGGVGASPESSISPRTEKLPSDASVDQQQQHGSTFTSPLPSKSPSSKSKTKSSSKRREKNSSESGSSGSGGNGSHSARRAAEIAEPAVSVPSPPAIRFTPQGIDHPLPRSNSGDNAAAASSYQTEHSSPAGSTTAASTTPASASTGIVHLRSPSPGSLPHFTDTSAVSSDSVAAAEARAAAAAIAAQFPPSVKKNASTAPAPRYDTFGNTQRLSPLSQAHQTLLHSNDLPTWLRYQGFDSIVISKLMDHPVNLTKIEQAEALSKMELKNLLGVKDGIRLYHVLREMEQARSVLLEAEKHNMLQGGGGQARTGSGRRLPAYPPASSFLPPAGDPASLAAAASSASSSSSSAAASSSDSSAASSLPPTERELHLAHGLYGHCSAIDCALAATAQCANKNCEKTLCVAHANKTLLTGSILCAGCYESMSYLENVKDSVGITAMQQQGYQLQQCSVQ